MQMLYNEENQRNGPSAPVTSGVTQMFSEHILAKSWHLFTYRQQVMSSKAETVSDDQ